MMRGFWKFIIAVGVLSCPPAVAQDNTIRQFDIPTLEKLGHDMYAQDQAAWHATDALLAIHPQADLLKENVHGWIVEDRTDGQLVRFIRAGENGPEAAYDITSVSGSKPVVSVPQDGHLTVAEKAQYAASLQAIKSVTQRCGDNYNTIVLKDPEGDGWLAWALAATTNPNLVMAGGHHRLTVSADGTRVIHMDALSRTCAVLEKGAPPQGSKIAALATTQLVSNLPVETFVFLNLEHRIPIIVLTPDRAEWGIENGKIARLGTVGEKPGAQ